LRKQEKTVGVYKSLESEKLGIAIEVGFMVNSTFDLHEVLALIMRNANQVTNSTASTLMLLDDKTGELVFSVPTGPKADRLIDIRLSPGKGIAGWVAEHKQSVLVPNARKDPRFFLGIDTMSGFETKSIICVPLKVKTKLIGVLEAINKADGTTFTEEDELLLCIFASQAAMAIENARLYGELKDRLKEATQMRKKIAAQLDERKRAEKKITQSLKEKEILLREIHHRVKNNMQVISSLLKLQSHRVKDKEALEIFRSSQTRIRAMALIHEKLYQSQDFTRVNFRDYLTSISRYLYQSYETQPGAIQLTINIEDLTLDITTAIPCGLIINELLSNSLKHAFPDGREGEITISLHSPEKDTFELTVSDNGTGIPEEIDIKTTDSLGLYLVKILTKDQLKGEITLDRSKGTTLIITFPQPEPKE
jgi:two-component sensor histidine kinase/putative methionine-R-sulfoxide reductase with GAF domain